MKVTRSFVPVVKVEITFPCSNDEFMEVRDLYHKVSSLDKVEGVLSEYGIYEDAQKQPNVRVFRTIERTSRKEEQVLKSLREEEKEEEFATPVIDAMEAAGLGRINISEKVRDYIRDNPGKSRSEIADTLVEKYNSRVTKVQFINSIKFQLRRKNIVTKDRRLYLRGQLEFK